MRCRFMIYQWLGMIKRGWRAFGRTRRCAPTLGLIFYSISGFAQSASAKDTANPHYQVHLHLTELANDLLPVSIMVPPVTKDSVEFHLPRIIPGTYDVHHYGRFVRNIAFLSAAGDTLAFRQMDQNRWKIGRARELRKITYRVADTYDAEENTGIFEPAGTSHEKEVFLLNNFGYVGYLKGYQNVPFELRIHKPRAFYGSTALTGQRQDTLDIFSLPDYFAVHDHPLLYCEPDTATRTVAGAKVLVSVYSPKNLVNARDCMNEIAAVLDATGRYLGGNLPVNKYAVLIYTSPFSTQNRGYGALEHHTSTVLHMPEFESPQFYSSVKDITAHEFFHIITPLGIHSEHIARFDFINPQMSRHIWLYEGVTEYNSHLVQVRNGLYSLPDFLEINRDKLLSAEEFNPDIPLTVASRYTLSYFKDQYYNFYQKGHLAALALDLKLIDHSNGEQNLIDLLTELSSTDGADTFFKDTELFGIIARHTAPEIEEFLLRHVAGAEPLPLASLLQKVGISYRESFTTQALSTGGIGFGYNFDTERLTVDDTSEIDQLGRDLGFQIGDEIVEFNGTELTLQNIESTLEAFFETLEEGDKVKMKVARKQEDGSYKTKKLKARVRMQEVTERHQFEVLENLSERQQRLRKKWLKQ